MNLLIIGVLVAFSQIAQCSVGDQSPYYQRCVEKQALSTCTDDGFGFRKIKKRPFFLEALQWNCEDECRYECMWKVVQAFQDRKWKTPQFYGKWPFIRFLGLQEPASVLFSILNFYAHARMLRQFRKSVAPNSPNYWLWHFFCLVSLNAWVWSTIFHARDLPFTELMDYTCAFSLVLLSCYCMARRVLIDSPRFVHLTLSTVFMAFFANHIAYLSMGAFDYAYNMQLNIIIGTFTAISWFGWSTYNRLRQPYVWKCAIFMALAGLVMLLEIIDMPPILWTVDCHALWHLATAPLTCLFYSFIIDDCNYLQEQAAKGKIKNKVE